MVTTEGRSAPARRPSIVVLGEATSHLAPVTENQVIQNIAGVGCTRIVIAQRVETVRGADLIVVLDCRRIVGLGSHEELLKVAGSMQHYLQTCTAVAASSKECPWIITARRQDITAAWG